MKRSGILALVIIAQFVGSTGTSSAQTGEAVEAAIATVSVTNLTKGQILTPAVFITHSNDAPPLFVPGEPASPELASLAELGQTTGLINKFNAEQGVLSVTRLGVFIRPGEAATINVEFDADHRLISSASMLEMTNDGFVSLLGAEVHCSGTNTVFVGGWDAGSEANTELCANVPAPCPVPARTGACSVEGAEGNVHVHSGIHGCGGFPAEIYDWGYPVAKITIQAAPDLSSADALAAACNDSTSIDSSDNDPSDDDGGNGN